MLTGKERILVIEDDPGVIMVMKGLFPLININAQFAMNGADGISLINEIIPDIIICDIMLPDMQGYDVLVAVKANSKTYKIPFVFLSAFAEPTDIRKGMDLGADDYLTKPFTSATLLKTIEARLEIKKKNDLIDSSEENEKWLKLFGGNFNHEFMTPLNGIINSVELMRLSADKVDTALITDLTNAIYSSGYRMMRNTKKLLIHTLFNNKNNSKPVLQKIENIDKILMDSIKQIEKQYYDRKINFKVTTNIDSEVTTGSYEYIKFLFDELLDNAYKFNLNELPIEVILKTEKRNKLIFEIINSTHLKNNEINTSNIKPFKKFHEAMDMNGLGLGLSNCIKICENLSYNFEIENMDGYMKISIEF
jgi:CheY-like chemotaxis protein